MKHMLMMLCLLALFVPRTRAQQDPNDPDPDPDRFVKAAGEWIDPDPVPSQSTPVHLRVSADEVFNAWVLGVVRVSYRDGRIAFSDCYDAVRVAQTLQARPELQGLVGRLGLRGGELRMALRDVEFAFVRDWLATPGHETWTSAALTSAYLMMIEQGREHVIPNVLRAMRDASLEVGLTPGEGFEELADTESMPPDCPSLPCCGAGSCSCATNPCDCGVCLGQRCSCKQAQGDVDADCVPPANACSVHEIVTSRGFHAATVN